MKQVYRIIIMILLAAGVALLSGCREAPTQEGKLPHHFAEFFVRYLQGEKELKAHASFFEGDSIATAVPKAFAGGAAFQGNSMEARNLPGGTIRYSYEQRSDYADSFKFGFQDDFGQKREISIAMAPVDSFAVQGGQASRSTGMSLYARGGKLTQGESMVLLFNDEENKASTIMLTGPSAGELYSIPAAKVEALRPGQYTLYLVKKKRVAEPGDSLSFLADIEFYTSTIEVEVVE
ncbi:MAG: hypothetical protein KDD19_07415 [Phaeodactylibacter sp.]|nr:hypothetical protein [Phaeodactylibacter sp.]MCB9048559.1 hypothetical protein [Lewinellaceae bacterium]